MPGKRESEVIPSTRLPDVFLEKHQDDNSLNWYEENRTAIAELNKFTEENGSFSDFHRSF